MAEVHGEVPPLGSDSAMPGLFVDLYQLTMASAYLDERLDGRAAFSLFARNLPSTRRFLLTAGLDAALTWLEHLRFSDEDVAFVETIRPFPPRFLDWLRNFRFSGDVFAMPEGTPVFANEPLVEVDAPIAEAQVVETVLLNQVTFATLIASKGIRTVLAAQGAPVIDFGTRRSHGIDAALTAARALYLAGFASTSNVEAGRRFGIPVTGTMAHSYIQAHEEELQAFRAFARQFPDTTLLVDTYDTLAGVEHVIELARELRGAFRVAAIRLDSGDLASLARGARSRLDAAGLRGVQIVASGGLDEHGITALRTAGTPIDVYAVGTRVNTSEDAPSLETAYKLVEYDGVGRRKLSEDKDTLPYRKQVFRRFEDGQAVGDIIGLADEECDGTPLLVPVMRDGRRTDRGRESLISARARAADAVAKLSPSVRRVDDVGDAYPVSLSPRLRAAI